jgi:hypothetical protein
MPPLNLDAPGRTRGTKGEALPDSGHTALNNPPSITMLWPVM